MNSVLGVVVENRSVVTEEKKCYKHFCPTISTEEYFKSTKDEGFHGVWSHLRAKLDYSYHSFYKKQRQWLHDSVIEEYMNNASDTDIPLKPWIVILTGVRGCGKGHTAQELIRSGRLPLLSYVLVDIDGIRHYLPESSSYTKDSQDLIDRTHKECGYIAETLTLAALESGRNVIFETSLRDPSWFKVKLSALKHKYPALQAALIHVTASFDTIMGRVEQHGNVTGKYIAKEQMLKRLEKMSESVHTLSAHVEFSCTIVNEGTSLALKEKDDSWEDFRSVFRQVDSIRVPKLQRLRTEDINLAPYRTASRKRRFSAVRSTEENHRADDMVFHGKFAHIREGLDYTYHNSYTFERQMLQDAIVSEFLDTAFFTDKDGQECTTPTEPWIVFTAGAMGAGKSYTMRSLVKRGLFPLLAFVRVDPDEIRRFLPEYHLYVQQSPLMAGELTQKEAGLISEILTIAGISTGKNVLVDGSLRDTTWYRHYFQQLRKQNPNARLAIIHVTAPRDAVLKRAADRAKSTGRVVPEEKLLATLDQVPKSVSELRGLVDYHIELRNASTIEIVHPEGESWEGFRKNWLQTCAWVPSKKALASIHRKVSGMKLDSEK